MAYLVLEELEVYRKALAVGVEIWNVVDKWNYFQKDTVGKQIIRSVDSIAANIAEVHGRYFYKEKRLFCFYSRGSILETKTWLTIAKSRNMISEKQYDNLITELSIVHKLLNGYIKTISQHLK